MNKVITLNLNGNAYQLEETGYEALRAYLETAGRRLDSNPDKAEIMADIEQAIAEKFRATLGPHKTVVVTREVQAIIADMGPVEDETADAAPNPEAAHSSASDHGKPGTPPPSPVGSTRRLYKIRDGSMLAGVCNGLAAYSQIDVTVIRVLFAVLTVFTYGSGILLYVLLVLMLPAADTAAEKAAAYGVPSTAEEFIRRAKEGYYEGMKSFHDRRAHREWRRKFKRDMRGWTRDFQREMSAGAHRAGETWQGYWDGRHPGLAGSSVALPFLALAKVAIIFAWIYASLSLIATGAAFGWSLPDSIPLWIGLIILFVVFQFLIWPLRAARHACYYRAGRWPRRCGGFSDSAVWIAMLALLVWGADRYIPEAHTALQKLPPTVHHAVDSLREWWGKR